MRRRNLISTAMSSAFIKYWWEQHHYNAMESYAISNDFAKWSMFGDAKILYLKGKLNRRITIVEILSCTKLICLSFFITVTFLENWLVQQPKQSKFHYLKNTFLSSLNMWGQNVSGLCRLHFINQWSPKTIGSCVSYRSKCLLPIIMQHPLQL